MGLREFRKLNFVTQKDAALILGIPVRTLRRYENNESYGNNHKRSMFLKILEENCSITETKGLLTIEQIKQKISELFDNEYKNLVDFCYLFGSYAKGNAKENSDVDLYISSSLTGFDFVGLIERVRQVLHKKVDMLRTSELINNPILMNEIMKEGIKIYF